MFKAPSDPSSKHAIDIIDGSGGVTSNPGRRRTIEIKSGRPSTTPTGTLTTAETGENFMGVRTKNKITMNGKRFSTFKGFDHARALSPNNQDIQRAGVMSTPSSPHN